MIRGVIRQNECNAASLLSQQEKANWEGGDSEREVRYYQSAIGNCPLTLGAGLSLARWVLPHSVSPPGGEKTGGGRERETRKAARTDSA